MRSFFTRRHVLEAVGAFLAVMLVAAGIWLFVQRSDRDSTAQPPPGGQPASPSEPSTTTPQSTTSATMTVKVYFHKGPGADPTKLFAVQRTVPGSPMVATAALNQLLAGPTSVERAAGYWSVFSSRTVGMLRSVRIGNGVGHADFRDFSKTNPNASSSTGSAVLMSELDATLKQFGTVKTTVYSFDGKVAPFYEWLQLSPPVGTHPTLAQARSVARDFLIRIAGMEKPSFVASRFISDWLASVDFRATIAGRATGHVSTVLLSHGAMGFSPIWATTETIAVDSPPMVLDMREFPPATSPLTVSGNAQAWEGTVNLRVRQDNGLAVRTLGEGYGTGGGDQMMPFIARVPFARPTTNQGWLVAAEPSAHNGEVVKVSAVQLIFAGAPVQPSIVDHSYMTKPFLPEFSSSNQIEGIPAGGWALPTGQGTIAFTVKATSTVDRVQLFMTPLGLGTTPTPRLLGTASRSGTTFTYIWQYANEPLLAKITVVATGVNGRSEWPAFNVFHG
jgi:spore germination protein GerM